MPSITARRVLIMLALVCAGVLEILVLRWELHTNPRHGIDLDVYRLGGQAWLTGQPVYGRLPSTPLGDSLPFTYPPFAAIVFATFAGVGRTVAVGAISLLSLAALGTTTWLVLRRCPRLPFDLPPLLASALLMPGLTLLEPVKATLWYGQVNLLLMVLIAADCLVVKPRWPRGLLIGIAAAIKLTPAVLIIYFLARREWKPALTVLASFAGAGLLGLALAPRDSIAFWLHAMLDPNRVGIAVNAENQSLRGALHRLQLPGGVESGLWLGLAVLVVALTWLAVARTRARGDDLAAMVATATCGLLVSPVSWSHHWVWCVPGVLMLGYAAWRWRSMITAVVAVLAGAVFVIAPHWLFPNGDNIELRWSLWQNAIADGYVWLGLALLVTLALRRDALAAGAEDDADARSVDDAGHVRTPRPTGRRGTVPVK
ncbi:MAG: DUF2029 domain-containing protein [Sciscionella sp.]|nr:DUF2029 domain-containing protein [Sciscionella sp.]